MGKVLGVSKFNKKLSKLTKGINTVIRPGLTEACKTATKRVKAEIRPMYKDVRQSIGWRVRSKQGNLTAKVGAAVGFKNARRQKFLAKQKIRRKGRKGVGFSPQNIDWWFTGTRRRTTRSGGNTGRMPKMNRGVSWIVISNVGPVFASMVFGARKGFGKLMR